MEIYMDDALERVVEGERAAMAAQGAARRWRQIGSGSWSNVVDLSNWELVKGDGIFINVVKPHFSIVGNS
jgi:hypothetical protein